MLVFQVVSSCFNYQCKNLLCIYKLLLFCHTLLSTVFTKVRNLVVCKRLFIAFFIWFIYSFVRMFAVFKKKYLYKFIRYNLRHRLKFIFMY